MTDGMFSQVGLVQSQAYLDSFKDVVIYGVAGTNGSGKDLLMDLLVERYSFLLFNTSNALREIATAAFQSTERGGNDTPMGRAGNAFRVAYPGGMVELGLLKWWTYASVLPDDMRPKGLVIGSIRGTGEVKRLKEVGGKLIVVDADPHVRFGRLQGRGRVDDPVAFEHFVEKEAAEMAVGETHHAKFGMAAVIDAADIRIENNGNDLEVFRAEAARILGLTA